MLVLCDKDRLQAWGNRTLARKGFVEFEVLLSSIDFFNKSLNLQVSFQLASAQRFSLCHLVGLWRHGILKDWRLKVVVVIAQELELPLQVLALMLHLHLVDLGVARVRLYFEGHFDGLWLVHVALQNAKQLMELDFVLPAKNGLEFRVQVDAGFVIGVLQSV